MEQRSPIHFVSGVAYNMSRFPIKEVLHAPYAMEHFDPELIRDYLKRLTPGNLLLTRISPDVETDRTSPWFKGEYSLNGLPAERIRPIDTQHFKLPRPNTFIAEQLSVKPGLATQDKPVNISNNPALTLWYKADTEFSTPKAQQYFSLQSPISSSSAQHAVLTQLLASWLNEASNEFAYPASLAGLDYSVYKHVRGITLQLGGYDDKQHLLLERLLTILTEETISGKSFALVKQSLVKRWQNADKAPLYRQIFGEVSAVLLQPHFSEAQLLSAIEPLNAEDLNAFRQRFLSQLHLEAMLVGNLTRQEADNSLQIVTEFLKPGLSADEVRKLQPLSLDGQKLTHKPDLEHNDNAWLKYYQPTDTVADYPQQARWMLLAHILQSPYYHEMRTRQQLGYVVFASYHPTLKLPGLSLLVQSPGHTPNEIQALSDRFIDRFSADFADIDEQEFTEQKAGLLAKILDSDDRLQARAQRLWREMALDETHFERRERLAAAVKALQPKDLQQLIQQLADETTGVLTVQYQSGNSDFTKAEALRSELNPVRNL